MIITATNGQNCRAGNYNGTQKIVPLQNIKAIETVIQKCEEAIHHFTFTFRDGTTITVGGTDPDYPPGRSNTFTIQDDERLLGAQMTHGAYHIYGITWLKRKA